MPSLNTVIMRALCPPWRSVNMSQCPQKRQAVMHNSHICMERTPSQATIHASYASSSVQTILKPLFPPVRKHPAKSNLVGIGNLLTGDAVRHISVVKQRDVHITPFMAKMSAAAEPAKKAKYTVHMRMPIFVSRLQTVQVRRVRMPSEIKSVLNTIITVKHTC
jgi:hypothetical protein